MCTEALTNAAKHAGASTIVLDVALRDGHLVTSVEDDGRGGADAGAGFGLRGLCDRLDALGGSLAIASPPGGGTRLTAVIPAPALPP